MTKEKTKSGETKPAKDSVSGKTGGKSESKTEKGDSAAAPSPDKASSDGKEAKSASSDASAPKKKPHVRGETQKPVSKAYLNNWNSIFKKKKATS